MDDQKDFINQALDRLGITILIFYLLLFGSLAQLESMNNTKQTKLDAIIANSFPFIYLGGWAIVVLLIIFS